MCIWHWRTLISLNVLITNSMREYTGNVEEECSAVCRGLTARRREESELLNYRNKRRKGQALAMALNTEILRRRPQLMTTEKNSGSVSGHISSCSVHQSWHPRRPWPWYILQDHLLLTKCHCLCGVHSILRGTRTLHGLEPQRLTLSSPTCMYKLALHHFQPAGDTICTFQWPPVKRGGIHHTGHGLSKTHVDRCQWYSVGSRSYIILVYPCSHCILGTGLCFWWLYYYQHVGAGGYYNALLIGIVYIKFI